MESFLKFACYITKQFSFTSFFLFCLNTPNLTNSGCSGISTIFTDADSEWIQTEKRESICIV